MRHNRNRMLLRRQTRAIAIALSLVVVAGAGCRSNARPDSTAATTGPTRGGELLVSARTEPRSFNRHAARDSSTGLVSTFINATLVRINRVSDTVEPHLAESWTASEDGRRVTMKLRKDVLFSDGQPFTADDVVFSFQAVYDERARQRAPGHRPGGPQEAGGRGRRSADGDDHVPGGVCAGPPDSRGAPHPAAPSSWRRAQRRDVHQSVESRHAADRARRPRAVRAEGVRAGPAAGLRPQRPLLRARRRRHRAALSRSGGARDHPRPERRAAAPGVGTARHHVGRNLTRRLRADEARRRPGAGQAARSRRLAQCGRACGSTSSRASSPRIRVRRGCSATSCGWRSRWRWIERSSPTRCSSARACRSSAPRRRRTRSGTGLERRRRRTTRRRRSSCSPRSASPIATATARSRTGRTSRCASRC